MTFHAYRTIVAEVCDGTNGGNIHTEWNSPSALSHCGFKMLRRFQDPSISVIPGFDTQMMVSVSKDAQMIVVTFRGSEPNLSDWLGTDFRANQVQCPYFDEGCGKIHAGFYGAWTQVKQRGQHSILAELARALRENPTFPVTVTGHSLGGGLATVAAMDIASMIRHRRDVNVVTFGSPRVGDAAFVRKFNSVIKTSRRIVAEFNCGGEMYSDFVTTIPPHSADQPRTSEASSDGSDAVDLLVQGEPSLWERAASAYDAGRRSVSEAANGVASDLDDLRDDARNRLRQAQQRARELREAASAQLNDARETVSRHVGEARETVRDAARDGATWLANTGADALQDSLQSFFGNVFEYRHVKGLEYVKLTANRFPALMACSADNTLQRLKLQAAVAHTAYENTILDEFLGKWVKEHEAFFAHAHLSAQGEHDFRTSPVGGDTVIDRYDPSSQRDVRA